MWKLRETECFNLKIFERFVCTCENYLFFLFLIENSMILNNIDIALTSFRADTFANSKYSVLP